MTESSVWYRVDLMLRDVFNTNKSGLDVHPLYRRGHFVPENDSAQGTEFVRAKSKSDRKMI